MNIFRLFPLLIFIFALLRFVLPLGIGKAWKAVIALILLAISQQRFLLGIIFPSIAMTELPSGIIVFNGFLFSIVALLTVFVALRDVFGLIFLLCRRKPPSFLFSSGRLALALFGASVFLSIFGVWQGIRVPDVRRLEITLRNLPPGLDGLTIVQLTDTHINRVFSEEWTRTVVEKTNALDPDIVLITGDTVDGAPERRFTDVTPLGELKARIGVFGAPGNHDYSYYVDWMHIFNELGIQMLLNEHVVITHNGNSLALIGITDIAAAWRGYPMPDIEAALSGIPDSVTRILMSHRPENARENADAGVDLQVSGHTHGGQLYGLSFIVKRANKGFVSGLYNVGNMRLYVSNGAGLWAGFPVRIGRPSEITYIILRTPPDD